jgi:hypothetical protein
MYDKKLKKGKIITSSKIPPTQTKRNTISLEQWRMNRKVLTLKLLNP